MHTTTEWSPPDGQWPRRIRGFVERCRDWLVSKPGRQLGEWGYQVARPLLLMEELIPSEDGRSPARRTTRRTR